LLSYLNSYQRDYYNDGTLKRDYSVTVVEADHETVTTLVTGVVKLASVGIKALILSQAKRPSRFLIK
jgi:hypothetical protein